MIAGFDSTINCIVTDLEQITKQPCHLQIFIATLGQNENIVSIQTFFKQKWKVKERREGM